MVARTREQRLRRYGLFRHLAMLVLVSLFLTLLLVLVTAQGISARDHSALTTLQRSVPQEVVPTNTPLPTDTPVPPTATPVPPTATAQPPTATPTIAQSATNTPAVANTPANNGNGGGAGSPTSPQSTKVVLSQPTVSNGSSDPLQGLSPSNFGTNGLLVATTLGCIVGLLGIVIGGIAFYKLVQSGYGPFLRALALGNRRNQSHRSRRRRNRSVSGRSSYNDDFARDISSPEPRRTNLGEYSGSSGNRGRRR
jgi:hypothetical protein